MWIFYVLAGVLSGIIGGMGMGGGTLLIPILTIFFALDQHLSQALNLLVFIPTGIISVIIHAKNKMLDFKSFFYIIIPAIVSSILLSMISNGVRSETLKIIFGIFLAVLGVILFIISIINHYKNKKLTKKLGV
ncbi:MAG: sulfite exporter TauE/SafE family protein [Clostridia bacterium]|nr:sulfite exporter TauE/SafE family protein [Clostridia bacterium]